MYSYWLDPITYLYFLIQTTPITEAITIRTTDTDITQTSHRAKGNNKHIKVGYYNVKLFLLQIYYKYPKFNFVI